MNPILSEVSDEELEEIDDGYVNDNEEGITDDYRENNYTLSEVSDEELEEIADNYEDNFKKEELLSNEMKEESLSDELIEQLENITDIKEDIAEEVSDKDIINNDEEDLTDEEKAMYHGYLNNEQPSNEYASEMLEEPTIENKELQSDKTSENLSLEEVEDILENVDKSSEVKEEIIESVAEPTNDYIKRMHEEYLNSQHAEDNASVNDDYITKFKNKIAGRKCKERRNSIREYRRS